MINAYIKKIFRFTELKGGLEYRQKKSAKNKHIKDFLYNLI